VSTILPPQPLDYPFTVRILLGESASAELAAVGTHFAVQAYLSPEHGGRFVLVAVPASLDALNQASRVIHGTHRAAKIKRP
jgi:hypothetical protein